MALVSLVETDGEVAMPIPADLLIAVGWREGDLVEVTTRAGQMIIEISAPEEAVKSAVVSEKTNNR
ncbi:hypothetical protein [Rhizobium sp. SGZ-381]|uniref:hypothetical protein n=1 Tax=Rhizobium sp. SGZ-381 TaxID=3342800 RepID=UPI00366B688B